MKLNIVCALKYHGADPITIDLPAELGITDAVETVYEIENQHGTWNKTTLKWWAKGEVDELFEDRLNFMKRCFNVAFTEWDIEIPLVLIQAESEEDADIVMEFGKKENDRYYADAGNVLAYAGYPNGSLKGYMKIFTDWDWEVGGRLNFISMVIHELGHLLGRPHSERGLWQDIMDPAINRDVTELSTHDVAGATA